MKKLTFLLITWFFVNTWPASKVSTIMAPFRSLSQCSVFRGLQQKLGARVSTCQQDGEQAPQGWTVIVNGGTTLSLTAGTFLDQETCENFRANVLASGEDGSSACWPH